MMIDWPYIENKYAEIMAELTAVQALNTWQIEPKGLTSTHHKTKYGMADIKGMVYINQAFESTSAFQLLEATIRHELAHLCVGIQQGHNSVFKAKARQFKAHFGRHLHLETAQVHKVIGYKYHLYAHLANGETLLFRRVHRKHNKYLNYRASLFKYLTIKGQKVISFNYAEN